MTRRRLGEVRNEAKREGLCPPGRLAGPHDSCRKGQATRDAERSFPQFAVSPSLPAVPPLPPEARPLPINLPTALQLANVRAVDVAAAADASRRQRPPSSRPGCCGCPPSLSAAITSATTASFRTPPPATSCDDSHQGVVLGAGPMVNLDIGQAIFAPLVARQQLAARQATLQTASNDTLVAVTDAYFNVQQARGELAGAIETTQRTEELVRRTKKLAPATGSRTGNRSAPRRNWSAARRPISSARERWKVASAELVRVLRLDPDCSGRTRSSRPNSGWTHRSRKIGRTN